MNHGTRTLTRILVSLALCFFALRGSAQDAKLQLANLDKLSAKAARVTDVTLDGSLLNFAIKLIESDEGDQDAKELKSIIKNLKGIYIKSFEFDEASQYSKADVEAIRSQLTSPRWVKIVYSINKRTNENDEIYLLRNGQQQVLGMVILVAEPRELTVVNIVGDVPVEKIAALHHFFADGEKQSSKNKQQKKESGHDQE